MLSVLCGGCGSVGYVMHVSVGQMKVLWAREALTPERIERLTPQEQRGVAALRKGRQLAESLGLERSTSYRHLIVREPGDGVHVVIAAPPDRLEAVTWWFPIVGSVAYRGYFDPQRAQDFAAGLRKQGLETYVRVAPLYSTLGFFDDPVPTSLLRWQPYQISETIVHEVVHETIFVSGDTAYNEALATFIAQHAILDQLAQQPELAEQARQHFADRRRFAELLARLSRDLRALYAGSEGVERRAELFRDYQKRIYPSLPWHSRRYDGFPSRALSNAYLLAHATYTADLPCFERELAELSGDLKRFIQEHIREPGRRRPAEECAEKGEGPWPAEPPSS